MTLRFAFAAFASILLGLVTLACAQEPLRPSVATSNLRASNRARGLQGKGGGNNGNNGQPHAGPNVPKKGNSFTSEGEVDINGNSSPSDDDEKRREEKRKREQEVIAARDSSQAAIKQAMKDAEMEEMEQEDMESEEEEQKEGDEEESPPAGKARPLRPANAQRQKQDPNEPADTSDAKGNSESKREKAIPQTRPKNATPKVKDPVEEPEPEPANAHNDNEELPHDDSEEKEENEKALSEFRAKGYDEGHGLGKSHKEAQVG
eukprot:CAMPEP_0183292808 /NCGR_PEP_ID=MMETSP0160_2-20130417/1728_1 /TAXON_ID=2839 ORGANISM="Odontella Sinensis, Strain Grunow 1884" /NCGR_SAMPLE_ID=MMETSP0160_2 /ASSEMBLY_ACC=CAM_ASM_000250 /LENGTH=261 /DNA_ID=CAMNT_0025453821 /DNA_START=117 /DNA_END=902 /DNA_ORIENTATION=+